MTLRILILEDNDAFKKVLELRLNSWRSDLSITFAGTLAEARAKLDANDPFNLAVLDQQLPDGLGWELLEHPKLSAAAVLAVSADTSPELPGQTVKAGAQHFLAKRQISEPLFLPLLEALLERKDLELKLLDARTKELRINAIKTLLATLRHEINNPLGAVLGGAYLVKAKGELQADQLQALQLVEASGNRIKTVLEKLCEAAELEEVNKANEQVFHVPGDKPWGQK